MSCCCGGGSSSSGGCCGITGGVTASGFGVCGNPDSYSLTQGGATQWTYSGLANGTIGITAITFGCSGGNWTLNAGGNCPDGSTPNSITVSATVASVSCDPFQITFDAVWHASEGCCDGSTFTITVTA